METFDPTSYRDFFRSVNSGNEPYAFQIDVAQRLAAGRNLVLQAPTGSGKTATVITPFLYSGWQPKPSRLIYALPLRTLAQSIYIEACRMAAAVECDPQTMVTIQTGEQPDDPFFDRGRIIVATYDQVLSGLLLGPYGLPDKLHNVNAAAIAGALLIFDEFHLMEPQRAFLTGAAGLHLFRSLAQSIWMTATATPPLVRELANRIGAEAAGPTGQEMEALPSVSGVARQLVYADAPLCVPCIAAHLSTRVIVIANTVARAQAIFGELTQSRPDVPAVLLHSRFFQSHRHEKEALLAQRFGKGTSDPALLVATQVIEAGVDISSDHLFTEMAPMNSLVQRAGRCARFFGEAGTVHVHALPDEPRNWLPYGDLRESDPALLATRDLLGNIPPEGIALNPTVATEWVAMVHGISDDRAIVGLWKDRLREIRDRIYKTAVARQPASVADLIREPSTADVTVILATQASLPERPVTREAITVNRWRLAELLRKANGPIGWLWTSGDSSGWEQLCSPEQLTSTFAVVLHPDHARYSQEIGLVVGESGREESPPRAEPPRPGHNPLRAEPWIAHARAVADVATERAHRDGIGGWLGERFSERFGLPTESLTATARGCALAHDLGKLQHGWQDWAAQSQAARDPSYRHVVPLAHTNFDAHDPMDRERDRSIKTRRPDHSAASAYLSVATLSAHLSGAQPEQRAFLVSAAVAAILAHHGGWLQSQTASQQDLGIQPLSASAPSAIAEVFGPGMLRVLSEIMRSPDRSGPLRHVLAITTGSDRLEEWWPLVAYFTRTLRLADQRATSQGGRSE